MVRNPKSLPRAKNPFGPSLGLGCRVLGRKLSETTDG